MKHGLLGKNLILGVVFLFVKLPAYSQQKPIEERISDDICLCFSEYSFTVLNERASAALDTCSTVVAKKYQAELERYFSSTNESSYQQGYEAGRLYFQQKIVPLLFTKCEAIKKLQIKKE